MTVDIYNANGEKTGQLELPDEVFNVDPHEHSMYLAVRAYLAHQRQGTHKAKERGEVRGGGRKPWRQKGRGTARAGTTRSPLWVGGGTIFGPRPRTYRLDLPRKVKRLARKSALSLRLRENNVVVVEDINMSEIKTKSIASLLKALKIDGEKTLQVLPEPKETVYRSSRNIKKLSTTLATSLSAYDILSHKKLLLHKSAVDAIVQSFGK